MVWVSSEAPADNDAYEPWSLKTLPLPALQAIRGLFRPLASFVSARQLVAILHGRSLPLYVLRFSFVALQSVVFRSISIHRGTKLSPRANLQRRASKSHGRTTLSARALCARL
jgi:hypothetical protein